MTRPVPQDHPSGTARCPFFDRPRRQRARQAVRCHEPELVEPDGSLATLSLLVDGRAVFSTDEELDPQDILDALSAAIEQIREELGATGQD